MFIQHIHSLSTVCQVLGQVIGIEGGQGRSRFCSHGIYLLTVGVMAHNGLIYLIVK